MASIQNEESETAASSLTRYILMTFNQLYLLNHKLKKKIDTAPPGNVLLDE